MARPLRLEFPGAIYHITSRGNARGMIFDDDRDREKFLDILASVIETHRWLCHAYCLMGNHYHLLIETPEANLCRGMRQLNGIYTQAFNRYHRRCGHLLQGRYTSILVEKESHLLTLCRYIVLNPVAARMVGAPEEWPWSSYLATAGLAEPPDFLSVDWVLSQFADQREKACRRYRAFVGKNLETDSPWDKLRGRLFLGGEAFAERLQAQLSEASAQQEIPGAQRFVNRPDLVTLLGDCAGDRPKAAREAHIRWGYTLREIGEVWGVHYATVSRMIRRREVLHCKT